MTELVFVDFFVALSFCIELVYGVSMQLVLVWNLLGIGGTSVFQLEGRHVGLLRWGRKACETLAFD